MPEQLQIERVKMTDYVGWLLYLNPRSNPTQESMKQQIKDAAKKGYTGEVFLKGGRVVSIEEACQILGLQE